MPVGLDLLGLAHKLFPFRMILREVPVSTPIGWFWNTFGHSEDRFKKLLEEGYKTFRIQVWWADSHAIVPVNVLRVCLEEIQSIVKNYPDITLYISPSCEHAEDNTMEVRRRLELVREIVPLARPVNNPWKGRGADVPGYLTEYHGGNPGRCDLASTDGTNIYDINASSWVEAYGNKPHPCFLWGARFNLREISDPGQKPPPIKDRKAAPSLGYVRSILRLLHPIGAPPDVSFQSRPFRSPNIYKTHAEDDQEPNENTPDELRENRPVLIIKPNVNSVDILNAHRKVIGRLARYGDYPGGFHRYYAGVPGSIGLYGYEIGNKVKKGTGSEFVWFRAGTTILGPVHPAFRQGSYRS